MDEYRGDVSIRRMLFGFFVGSATYFLLATEVFELSGEGMAFPIEWTIMMMFGWGSVGAIIGWAASLLSRP